MSFILFNLKRVQKIEHETYMYRMGLKEFKTYHRSFSKSDLQIYIYIYISM